MACQCHGECVMWMGVNGSANGHCTASQYSAIPKHRALLTRTNQKFHHNFSVFNASKLLKIMLKYSYLHLTLIYTPKCYFFRWKALFHWINKIPKMATAQLLHRDTVHWNSKVTATKINQSECGIFEWAREFSAVLDCAWISYSQGHCTKFASLSV